MTRQVLFGGTANDLDVTTNRRYQAICAAGHANWTATELDANFIMPADGTLSNLRVELERGTPADANEYAFDLRVNGASSGLGCTVGGTAGDKTCTETASTINISAGDLVALQVVANSGFASSGAASWTFIWNSTTANQSILLGIVHGLPSGTNTRYMTMHGGDEEVTTESVIETLIPTGATLKSLYVRSIAGLFATRVWTVRKNAADTGITVTVNNVAAQTASDTVHTDTVVDGDEISIQVETTGAFAETGLRHSFGLVFETDVEGEFLAASNSSVALDDPARNTMKISGRRGPSTVANQKTLAQYCRLIRMRIRTSAAPATGKEIEFEAERVVVAGADHDEHLSGLKVTLTDAGAEGSVNGEILIQDDEVWEIAMSGDTGAGTPTAQACCLLSTAPRARGGAALGSANPMVM